MPFPSGRTFSSYTLISTLDACCGASRLPSGSIKACGNFKALGYRSRS
jgi:hypothetical protein